jgi:hypothetical protein
MNELRHCDLGSQARPPITITLRRDTEYAYKVILPFPACAVPRECGGISQVAWCPRGEGMARLCRDESGDE